MSEPLSPSPPPALRRPSRRRGPLFWAAIVAASTVVLAVSLVIPIIVISALNGGLPTLPFLPGQGGSGPGAGKDPGTYHAGHLRVPQTLGSKPISKVRDDSDVTYLKDQRDGLSRATGGAPAVAARYGGLLGATLMASQGYTDPVQYMGTAPPDKVKFTTHGTVHCGTAAGASICIRSEQARMLTVVVAGQADDPKQVADQVEEAWRDLGGG